MSFIIKRIDGKGGYVAPDGSESSYVKDAFKAKRFATKEAAQKELCIVNETILELK